MVIKGDKNYDQRLTVPAIVVEITTGAVVNNDYHVLDILLARAFKKFIPEPAPDIYPVGLEENIDALNIVLYSDINLAVNLAALTARQEDYEFYFNQVFDRLEWVEERLSTRRYLMWDTITSPIFACL